MSTAKRLAKEACDQGCDAHIIESKAFQIFENRWFSIVDIVGPSKEDLIAEKRFEEDCLILEKKNQVIAKARELGLTEEDIDLLK